MAIVMHFSTFLKLLTLNSGEKFRELSKYERPGGFDFYRPSREGLRAYSAGKDDAACLKSVLDSSTEKSLPRNKAIFEGAATWAEAQPGVLFTPEKRLWKSPSGVFSVRLEPEIGFDAKGKSRVIAIYPAKGVRINRDQAGVGILVLRSMYGGSDFRFGILDVDCGKAYWTPTNISPRLLDSEVSFIEEELRSVAA